MSTFEVNDLDDFIRGAEEAGVQIIHRTGSGVTFRDATDSLATVGAGDEVTLTDRGLLVTGRAVHPDPDPVAEV